MIRRGIATFGLDTGKCPPWLFERMVKIPDKPTIPLSNWLLDLTSKDDLKRSSVFVIGIKSIVNDLWDEMVKYNLRTLNVRKLIPNTLGVNPMMIYYYKSGQKAISISTPYKLLKLWKEKCNKSGKEFVQKWQEVFNADFQLRGNRGQQMNYRTASCAVS